MPWGPVTKLEQDRNGTVGGGGDDREMSWSYARATGGRNTVRLTGATLPDGSSLTYEYLSASNALGDSLSRLTRIKLGANVVALYKYTGLGMLVGTVLPVPDVYSVTHGASTGDYLRLDNFNRITDSRWMAVAPTPDRAFYEALVSYDANSNIETVEDRALVTSGGNGLFDVKYTIDGLNRVTQALEGHLSAGSISGTTRDELWTLTQTGNWDLFKRDLDGDLNYNETNELNDDRTHNVANELTARDIDDNGTDNYTLTYDLAGQQTTDGKEYNTFHDAWARLRQVKTLGNSLVAEYRYNGLGQRISWIYNNDSTLGVGAGDKSRYD